MLVRVVDMADMERMETREGRDFWCWLSWRPVCRDLRRSMFWWIWVLLAVWRRVVVLLGREGALNNRIVIGSKREFSKKCVQCIVLPRKNTF